MQLTEQQQCFATFLADCWYGSEDAIDGHAPIEPFPSNRRFWHSYGITGHGAWRTWKQGGTENTPALQPRYNSLRALYWWCESLSQASAHFSWSENQIPLPILSGRLQNAIGKSDALLVRNECLEVFRWGGVARNPLDRSRVWVNAAFEAGSLIADIQAAMNYLRPFPSSEKPVWPDGLLMNSAMTKVYAAADSTSEIIIYDGRVGGALGLLARRFLEERGVERVPADLAFLWGPAQGKNPVNRDPSSATLTFRSLYQKKNDDVGRASTARIATAILSRMQGQIASRAPTMRQIEQSLFMIGYNVDSLSRSSFGSLQNT